nr:hypothetical protein CFP56_42904 [Quercus suber]
MWLQSNMRVMFGVPELSNIIYGTGVPTANRWVKGLNIISQNIDSRLMVSTLINEYLISRTCGLPLKTEKKLEQKLGFNLVTDNYLMNDLIAGSFG